MKILFTLFLIQAKKVFLEFITLSSINILNLLQIYCFYNSNKTVYTYIYKSNFSWKILWEEKISGYSAMYSKFEFEKLLYIVRAAVLLPGLAGLRESGLQIKLESGLQKNGELWTPLDSKKMSESGLHWSPANPACYCIKICN